MVTHLITTEIPLSAPPIALHGAIERHLHQWGDPLRWAITAVNPETQTVTVEAIVTSPA